MPAGLGGGGSVYIALEPIMGTLVPPTAAGGVWCPIISEDLEYREDKYYSPQIRQQTIVSDVQSSYYHVEGSIVIEADPNFAPYFMYASRHLISKVGSAGSFTYRVTPGSQGSAASAGTGTVARTLSITIVRNNVAFGYAGCVVNTWEETIENGVLRWNLGILGISEADAGNGTPTWVDPVLFGADAHSIFVDSAGTAPPFAGAFTTNFNGWTFRSDFNGSAQNRIQPLRSASYIAYGETIASYETELDFIDKTDYTNMKNNTTRSIKKESIKPGGSTWATCDTGLRTTVYRTSFDNYVVNLAGMGDLIMARVTGRAVGIAGGAAYAIECKSHVDIT